MNVRSGIALGVVASLALVPVAAAQKKPPKPPNPTPAPGAVAITLDAKPNPLVFGRTATLSGRLSGPVGAGVAVRLEQDKTLPLGDKFEPAGMETTAPANGRFQFAVRPSVSTQYRVVAKAKPDVMSRPRLISVRTRVGLRLSTSTPRAGARVRFSGSVLPAHDGASVRIQRRTSTGGFTTVARSVLRDAGTARSTYSRFLRVRRDGVYRVKLAGDSDHVNGFSGLRAINVR